MPGRPIPDETVFVGTRYDTPELRRRREVLRETLARLELSGPALREAAQRNHTSWLAPSPAPVGVVEVHPGDWGDVTLAATQRWGARFAVLNMANAYCPGGAYVEGTAAQEENLFRRTDCHFRVDDAQLTADRQRYRPEMIALLSAEQGGVYLDVERPRLCVRGSEDRTEAHLGYRWLPEHEVFEFYELRAAALDLRRGGDFQPEEMRRRIQAQFDTLRAAGVRHVVLSAFGCGAFRNPAPEVARIYAEVLAEVREDFAVVAFAIFHPGYGPDNFTPFHEVLGA